MPLALNVPDGGAKLQIVKPDQAQPGKLYLITFKGGAQGPIVMAREHEGNIQIGPLPENTEPTSIERLSQLPSITRIEVEGVLTEDAPPPLRVIELIGTHANDKKVVLYLASE